MMAPAQGRRAVEDANRFARRGIQELEPYPFGKPLEEVRAELGLPSIDLLDTNENPLGPSPLALEAMRRELAGVNRYPDGPCTPLARKLAGRLGIEEDMILFGNGADGCLTLVGHAFIDEGDEVIVAAPTFPEYETVTRIMGGRPIPVPLRDHVHDLEAMHARIGSRTKLVFVCNPNNPTGSIVEPQALDAFVRGLPPHVLLVLDEAYLDFLPPEHAPDSLSWIRAGRPVLSLRTFSKVYGLAGLRIGCLLADRGLIGLLQRVRQPFTVSGPAQAASLAALDDAAFVRRVLENNEAGKRYLYRELERLALPCVPSLTNFLFVDLQTDSREMQQALLRRGVLVRAGHPWGRPTFIRFSIGTMEQNRRLIAALEEALKGKRGMAG
jgi:histidinol-phosphate aminotransferase